MNNLGIIGFGALGRLLGEGFKDNFNITYYDPNVNLDTYHKQGSIYELITTSDLIVIATPASVFKSVINEICQYDLNNKLVLDVLSTKILAKQIYQKHLADHENILSLHPLFGPPSYTKFEPGLRVVSSYKVGSKAAAFETFLEKTHGFKIINKSAEEHDRHMAYHHALPFILAHSLAKTDFNKDPGELTIPSEEKLRKIVDIAGKESEDLYLTIMRSNPYAIQAVEDLIKTLQLEQLKLWP